MLRRPRGSQGSLRIPSDHCRVQGQAQRLCHRASTPSGAAASRALAVRALPPTLSPQLHCPMPVSVGGRRPGVFASRLGGLVTAASPCQALPRHCCQSMTMSRAVTLSLVPACSAFCTRASAAASAAASAKDSTGCSRARRSETGDVGWAICGHGRRMGSHHGACARARHTQTPAPHSRGRPATKAPCAQCPPPAACLAARTGRR